MDYIESLVEEFKQKEKISEELIGHFNKFCNNITSNANSIDELFYKEIIKNLFYISLKTSKMSRSKFFISKKFMLSFYEFICEKTNSDKSVLDYIKSLSMNDIISSSEVNSIYFKDLDQVINFIKSFGELFDYDPDTTLLNVKAAAILAWYGVTIEEMTEIKKVDLLQKTNSVLIKRKGKTIPINIEQRFFMILLRFSKTDTTVRMSGKRIQRLVDSEFLFRSERSAKLDVEKIQRCFARFNKWVIDSEASDKQLNFIALKQCGIFCDLLKDENENKQINAMYIANKYGITFFTSYDYYHTYNKWKEKYKERKRIE